MKNMNRLIATIIVFLFVFSLTACEGDVTTEGNTTAEETSNKNGITMYNYCPSLNDFLELLKVDGRKILGYEEKKNDAYWYTSEDLGESTYVECTEKNLVFHIQVNEDYSDLLTFLRTLPGSVSSEKELNDEFSSVVETTNKIVSGVVVYTDKSQFSKNGITYNKTVTRTPERILTQIVSAQCEDVGINPYEYPDLRPNLSQEEFYNIAEAKESKQAFDEALFYYTCAESYKDSLYRIKECMYQLASGYYKDGNLIEAGKYFKEAGGHKDSNTVLLKITETLYDDAVFELYEYSNDGSSAMLEKAYTKFAVFDETYKEIKRFLNIAKQCKSGCPDDDLLNDELVKKIVQKHMLFEFLNRHPEWCCVEKESLPNGDEYYIVSAEFSYYKERIDLSLDSPKYDVHGGLLSERDLSTSDFRSDYEWNIPSSLQYYSINNGVFVYDNSPKFEIEILQDKEICVHSFLSGKKYIMKQRNSKEIQELLNKNTDEW